MKIDTENSAPWLNLNKFEFCFKLQMQASNRHLIDKIATWAGSTRVQTRREFTISMKVNTTEFAFRGSVKRGRENDGKCVESHGIEKAVKITPKLGHGKSWVCVSASSDNYRVVKQYYRDYLWWRSLLCIVFVVSIVDTIISDFDASLH